MSCEDCDCGGCDDADIVIQASQLEILKEENDRLKVDLKEVQTRYQELQTKLDEANAALRMVNATKMLKEIQEELVHCPECTIMSGNCNCELESET